MRSQGRSESSDGVEAEAESCATDPVATESVSKSLEYAVLKKLVRGRGGGTASAARFVSLRAFVVSGIGM